MKAQVKRWHNPGWWLACLWWGLAPADGWAEPALVCEVSMAQETEQAHHQFRIVDDRDGQPAANMAYGIRCGERLFEGMTGDDGFTMKIEAPIGVVVTLEYVVQTAVGI